MKFICSVENGTTFVALDLKAIPSLPGEFDYMRTICMFRGTYHAFDFTIINEFLSRLDKITLKHIVSTLSNMRRCIANSGHDDPAADKCVGEISQYMKELVEYTPMYLTGNILKELYRYSKKFITKNSRVSKSCSVIDRKMFITASLLSALCVMVIHDFETHFTDVDEPLQVLYPVFEEAIKNSGIDGAKKFVEKCRTLMEDMNGDSASWVIEVIYINGCMIHDHGPGLPIDVAVIENYTQRILSSKSYFANKRIKEMKEINKAEEQQRMENNKVSVNPLTDDEIKEFNTEVENNCLLPIRNGLKDALDAILLTVNYFYRHFPSDAKYPDLSTDDLRDSITTAVSTATLKVDEMGTTELAKIAEHANYVYDAFKLVEQYIPDGVLFRNYQPMVRGMSFPHEGYLRKVLDILNILCIPAMQYKGSDIGYGTAMCLKSKLAEFPGGKTIISYIPGDPGYIVYNNKPLVHPYNSIYPTAMSTLRLWSEANLDDTFRDKFFAFLMRHESDIFKYIQVKQLCNPLSEFAHKDMCTFFYRWFLNEQTTK